MPIDRLSCEETFRLLDRYLDRALDVDELRRVEAHLETCAECAGEYRFEGRVLEEVRAKLARIEGPSEAIERIAARLAAADREAVDR